ncbi:MAG: hypothetical protein KGH65_03835 [Candidatus Micrarchaeota archaeon]|nr:hypothetical protein [Candidatus Micrarchaeota archaeon]
MNPPLSYKLGAWLPDNPPLVNPAFPPQMEAYFNGGEVTLSTAQNALWRDGAYRPYLPLVGATALPSACLGAISCYDSTGAVQVFAGTATDLYKLSGGAWTKVSRITPAWAASTVYALNTIIVDSNGNQQQVTTAGTSGSGTHPTWATTLNATTTDGTVTWTLTHIGTYNATRWSFQQFGDCLDATDYNDPMQTINITTGTNFAALDTTAGDLIPTCKVLGVIRDFLVAGYTNDTTNGVVPNRVQWSAIDNDASWPFPATQAAYAAQAGAQTLYSEYGPVMFIGDGEQFGLIFQANGIVRVTYIGGNAVFDFVTYEKRRGAIGQNAVAKVGERYYFLAPDGFFVTDGNSVSPIGVDKFDKWFFANAKPSALSNVIATVDTQAKCVYFAFQSNSGTNLDSLLVYNYVDNKATYCLQNAEWYFQTLTNNAFGIGAFDTNHKYGGFTGAAGTATFTTQDFMLNPGGRAFVNQVRGLGEGLYIAAIGTRNDLNVSTSLSLYNAQDPRALAVPMRAEGRYHRISTQYSGSFTDAIGFTVWQTQSGQL